MWVICEAVREMLPFINSLLNVRPRAIREKLVMKQKRKSAHPGKILDELYIKPLDLNLQKIAEGLLIDRICSQTTKLGTLIPATQVDQNKGYGKKCFERNAFGYFDKKNLKYKRQKNTSYRKSFSIKLRPLVTSCINV